jgi:hypothetical protein
MNVYKFALRSGYYTNRVFIYDIWYNQIFGVLFMNLICSRHGISDHRLSGIKWKCKKCEYVYSRKYLDKLKLKAMEYAGKKCQKCGYDKCFRALHFHHIDPKSKEFAIFEGRPGYKKTRSWEKLKVEIDKCILLCSNCHMELHNEDEKIIHSEIEIKLSRTDMEYLNKSILKNIFTAEQALEKGIEIILKRHPKLNRRELRHQQWLKENNRT